MKVAHRFRVPAEVVQLVRGLHPEIKRKVRSGLDLLGREPHAGKALQGELAGPRSLRLGAYRIVYRVGARRTVEIVTVGPRKTIYEQTLRLVRARGTGPADARLT